MDEKCSNDVCQERATLTLDNGDDVQRYCRDCLAEVAADIVMSNDDAHFGWDDDHRTVRML